MDEEKQNGQDQGMRSNEGGSNNAGWQNGQYWPQPQGYGAKPRQTQPVKKRSWMHALVALLLCVCLLGGIALGTFLVAPFANQLSENLGKKTAQLPAAEQQEEAPPVVREVPKIGGESPNIEANESPIVQIAKEVGPAIVGVTVSVDQRMGRELTEIESGYGTGIVLTENGYIVTNYHVIEGSDYVKVTLYDSTEYNAVVIGVDKATDIAVLKIEALGLKAVALGNSDELQVGEGVVAIGNPLGASLAGSVTSGIVSALNREITTPNGFSQKYIQTDAAINPGNSGGPLVNLKGEVIGINTLKSYLAGYDNYGVPIGTEGIGFAIPISSARPLIEQLIATGVVERPGIGISCLVDETNRFNPVGSPQGVTIIEVVEGGPADRARLMPNDIIMDVDGEVMDSVETLVSLIKSKRIGEELMLTVWRSGQEYQTTVVVGNLNDVN